MPFKMLTKSVVAGTQFGQEASGGVHHNGESFAQQSDMNRPEDEPAANSVEENKKDQKVKPFQVQLIKVISSKKKKKKGNSAADQAQTVNVVNILKNASQSSADISNLSKRELMQHLKSKLDSIQTQADSIKQNLYEKEAGRSIQDAVDEEEKK